MAVKTCSLDFIITSARSANFTKTKATACKKDSCSTRGHSVASFVELEAELLCSSYRHDCCLFAACHFAFDFEIMKFSAT